MRKGKAIAGMAMTKRRSMSVAGGRAVPASDLLERK
jgi:hypothetical protein